MASDSNRPHFVWVRSHAGPMPQKWGELNYGVNSRMAKDGTVIGSPKELSDMEWTLDIDILAKLYPCPPQAAAR